MDNWHELCSRRDLQHVQRASYRRTIGALVLTSRIIGYTSIFVAPIVLLIYFGVAFTLSLSLALPIGIVLGILVFVSLGIFVVAFSQKFYARSIDYMTMADLSSSHGYQEQWWRRIGNVLPEREDKIVPSRRSYQVPTIILLR